MEVCFNPVPEKARFIADYVVVTKGIGSAANATLACILFFGAIFPLLVENRNKLNMIAWDCFTLAHECLGLVSICNKPIFQRGMPGVGFILLSTLRAQLIIRVRFAVQTEISKCYYRVSVIWLRNGSL